MNSYELNDNYPPVVIENGSSACRMGFAGDDAPLSVVPAVIGRAKYQAMSAGTVDNNFIGYKAQDMREILSLSYPIEHGIVVNWDDMEKIWNYALFSELHVSPEQHPILTTESPCNPKGSREKMAQVMFEKYGTPAFYVAFEPVLSLFSTGRNIGAFLSVGDGVTHITGIYEGYISSPSKRFDFGGRDLTHYLQHLLFQRGQTFSTSAEIDLVREVKESMCYVAEDSKFMERTKGSLEEKSYQLPDGSSVKLGLEQHQCPEILFQPDGIFNQAEGLTQMVHNCINECDCDNRADLYTNIILTGGSTLFGGFADRLKNEVKDLAPNCMRVNVVASPERKYHVWIGGSILGSLSSFGKAWVTREDYNEHGPNILHRKCLG